MQKLSKINKEKKKPGKMRKVAAVAALASLLAVEPLMGCASVAAKAVPKSSIAYMEPECRGKIPFQKKKSHENEASVSQTRLQEIMSELRKSTVFIESDESIGSGVILYSCGGETAILTNRHVVQSDLAPEGEVLSADNLEIKNDDKTVKPIRILYAPDDLDFAIVFVDENIGPPVSVAQNKPNIGARVIIVGNPLGIEDSVSTGIISNFVNDHGFEFEAIQTDAAINPGSSGGGVFLANGELLGIATLKPMFSAGFAEGLAFAIPMTTLEESKLDSWAEMPTALPEKK